MKVFVYSNNKNNFFDFKLKHFPIVLIEGIVFAESIGAADAFFAAKTGINLIKSPHISCAPMELTEFAETLAAKFNQISLANQSLLVKQTELEYTIHGLNEPWLKKVPDYMI